MDSTVYSCDGVELREVGSESTVLVKHGLLLIQYWAAERGYTIKVDDTPVDLVLDAPRGPYSRTGTTFVFATRDLMSFVYLTLPKHTPAAQADRLEEVLQALQSGRPVSVPRHAQADAAHADAAAAPAQGTHGGTWSQAGPGEDEADAAVAAALKRAQGRVTPGQTRAGAAAHAHPHGVAEANAALAAALRARGQPVPGQLDARAAHAPAHGVVPGAAEADAALADALGIPGQEEADAAIAAALERAGIADPGAAHGGQRGAASTAAAAARKEQEPAHAAAAKSGGHRSSGGHYNIMQAIAARLGGHSGKQAAHDAAQATNDSADDSSMGDIVYRCNGVELKEVGDENAVLVGSGLLRVGVSDSGYAIKVDGIEIELVLYAADGPYTRNDTTFEFVTPDPATSVHLTLPKGTPERKVGLLDELLQALQDGAELPEGLGAEAEDAAATTAATAAAEGTPAGRWGAEGSAAAAALAAQAGASEPVPAGAAAGRAAAGHVTTGKPPGSYKATTPGEIMGALAAKAAHDTLMLGNNIKKQMEHAQEPRPAQH